LAHRGLTTLGVIPARRKHNASERRQQLADAAIELLGRDGARGLSHPRVDAHAGVPRGSTSFYFRTRRALLQAAAARLTELDIADLSFISEPSPGDGVDDGGTAALAKVVMYAATEPGLTRTKARYEIALHSSRDPELASTLQQSVDCFYRLAQTAVGQWHGPDSAYGEDLIQEQAIATLTFVNGVMFSFITGHPIVTDARHLDLMIQAVISGIIHIRNP
jgi:DNA-binding transcriptional regulator YbjK